jgi:hypothetical protein
VYECQSPSDSSELPGYLNASLPALYSTSTTYITFFSNPPRQTTPERPKSFSHEATTLGAQQDIAPVLKGSTRGRPRGGRRKYSTSYSNPSALSDSPRHSSPHEQSPSTMKTRHMRANEVRRKVVHALNGSMREGRGEDANVRSVTPTSP